MNGKVSGFVVGYYGILLEEFINLVCVLFFMAERYLLDTCVWRDYLEQRTGPGGRPLGNYAGRLFVKIFRDKVILIVPEMLVLELRNWYSDVQINTALAIIGAGTRILMAYPAENELSEAKILAQKRNLPFPDCIMAVQARNKNAIFVSQDKHVLIGLSDVVVTFRPEEIC